MDNAELFFDCAYAEQFTRSELSMLDDKASIYAAEPAYRETLYELARYRADPEAIGALIRGVGIGLIRPDAVAHSKVIGVLDYFGRLGVRPLDAMLVTVGRSTVRDVWRYQLTAASGQRIRLLDLVFEAGPSILTLFAADPGGPGLPCTVLMADTKGPADVSDRQGWELRSALNSPNRIEVYVHCGDEPADVVRDGGLLLGPAEFAVAVTRAYFPEAVPGPVSAHGSGQAHQDAVVKVTKLADEVRACLATRRLASVDPLFSAALAEVPEPARPDRWQLIRTVAAHSPMTAGTADSIISDSGIRRWWENTGLLGAREAFLRMRTNWRSEAALAEPMP